MTRFDLAAAHAIQIAEEWAVSQQRDVVVVRDLVGRNSLAVFGEPAESDLAALKVKLSERCAPFVGGTSIIRLTEMIAPELITDSVDRHPAPFTLSPSGRVTVLERGTVGAEWLSPNENVDSRRVALYGFKGDVGRSSAAFTLAHHLAGLGRVVLVIDLDLESPGVSTMLAPALGDLPQHGILDHLVEYGVGNDHGLEMVARSNAMGSFDGNGEVWFAAAEEHPKSMRVT